MLLTCSVICDHELVSRRLRIRHIVAFRCTGLLEHIGTGFQVTCSHFAVDVSDILFFLFHTVFTQLKLSSFDRSAIVVLEHDLKEAFAFFRVAMKLNFDMRISFLFACQRR